MSALKAREFASAPEPETQQEPLSADEHKELRTGTASRGTNGSVGKLRLAPTWVWIVAVVIGAVLLLSVVAVATRGSGSPTTSSSGGDWQSTMIARLNAMARQAAKASGFVTNFTTGREFENETWRRAAIAMITDMRTAAQMVIDAPPGVNLNDRQVQLDTSARKAASAVRDAAGMLIAGVNSKDSDLFRQAAAKFQDAAIELRAADALVNR